MKKIIISIIFTILIACSDNSTENNSKKNNNDDYYVKCTVYVIYNNQKRIKREIYFDGKIDPSPTKRRFFECFGKDFRKYDIDISYQDDLDNDLYYNKLGCVTKCNFYKWQVDTDSENIILNTRLYYYNELGLLYSIKFLHDTDTTGCAIYKSNNGKIQEIFDLDSSGKAIFEYNANGYVSKEMFFNYYSPKSRDTIEYKQNNQGYLIEIKEKKYFNNGDIEINKIIYQYYEQGRPLNELHYDDKDSLIKSYNYKYENNLLKQRGNIKYFYDKNMYLIQSNEGEFNFTYEYDFKR